MKIYIDNNILKRLTAANTENTLINFFKKTKVEFCWPSLLEFLGCGSLFENLPLLDMESPLFAFIISSLTKSTDKETFIRLYDQVFVECLTQIKALPQINQQFLLECIQSKQQNLSVFAYSTLDKYEAYLRNDPSNAMHDLTLYLAWDRVCVNFGILFDYHNQELPPLKGLEVFRECLLESFQHITAQGRTQPGFFRLLEALYAYQMRDEKIQSYSEEEWLVLCKASAILRPRNQLSDVFYIDCAVRDTRHLLQSSPPIKVFTSDAPEMVEAGLAFAHYIVGQLKAEGLVWHYTLSIADVESVK